MLKKVACLATSIVVLPVALAVEVPAREPSSVSASQCETKLPGTIRFNSSCITDKDITPCRETLRFGFQYEKDKNFVGTRDIVGTDDAALKKWVAQSGPFSYLGYENVATLKRLKADYKRGIADKKRMSPEQRKEYGPVELDEANVCIVDMRIAYLEKAVNQAAKGGPPPAQNGSDAGQKGNANDKKGKSAGGNSSRMTNCPDMTENVSGRYYRPTGPGRCPGEINTDLTNNSGVKMTCQVCVVVNGKVTRDCSMRNLAPGQSASGEMGGFVWCNKPSNAKTEHVCMPSEKWDRRCLPQDRR